MMNLLKKAIKGDKLSDFSIIIGILLFLGFGYFFIAYRSFLPLFICLAYISFYKYNEKNENTKIFRFSFLMLFIASVIAYTIFTIKYFHPGEWDFTCFYLYGKVAVAGLNFYSPHDYYSIIKSVDLPMPLSNEFAREMLDVGCPYPPPTLLLFSTLGFFSFGNAFIFWFLLNHFFLLGSIVLIKNIFFEKTKYLGIMMAVILLATFNATLLTNSYAQILFILLFTLLMAYKYREKPISGLYLALAIFLKPFIVILFFYYIITGKFRSAGVFILSCIGICFITFVFFGYQPFSEYIINNPTLREPDWLFTEGTNQSLLAELLRSLPGNQSIARMLYVSISFILLAMTTILIYKNKLNKKKYDVFFPILLAFSLIVYPSGQYNYPIVHILSILILLTYFRRLEVAALLVFAFYMVSYAGLLYVNIFILTVSVIILYKEKFTGIYQDISASLKPDF